MISSRRVFVVTHIAAILALIYATNTQTCDDVSDSTTCNSSDEVPTGKYATWDEAPKSIEEFDHGNDRSVCRLPFISVEEWEEGRYWERDVPVIVRNVTDHWKALEHWTKEEMVRRYPDVMVGMGASRDLGQTGPDDAGDALTKTTIKDFIANHMHEADKYVFDRKLNMPDGLLEDCMPYPMPTRMYHEDAEAIINSGLQNRLMWKDHLALTIGRDLQGLTFHRHNAAWNTVIFGAKRWLLYDSVRFEHNITRLKRMTRDINNPIQLTGADWIRKLYDVDERKEELRTFGHDCIQRAGEMIYVPSGWAHMVVNIGDTVAVVSERGLDAMEA
eukprot:g10219.t1 g10219   contig4:1458046-1459257(-)